MLGSESYSPLCSRCFLSSLLHLNSVSTPVWFYLEFVLECGIRICFTFFPRGCGWLRGSWRTHRPVRRLHPAHGPFSPRALFSGCSSALLIHLLYWHQHSKCLCLESWWLVELIPQQVFSSGTAELFLSLCSFIHIFKSPCQVYFCFRGVDHSVHPEERGGKEEWQFWDFVGRRIKWPGKTTLLIRFSTPRDLEVFIAYLLVVTFFHEPGTIFSCSPNPSLFGKNTSLYLDLLDLH